MKVFPFEEVAATVEDWIEMGVTTHQEFICDGCLANQRVREPNKMFDSYKCAECGYVTDLRKAGCNYSCEFSRGPVA